MILAGPGAAQFAAVVGVAMALGASGLTSGGVVYAAPKSERSSKSQKSDKKAQSPSDVSSASRAFTRNLQGDLTMESAVRIALRQNPDILKALEEIRRTRGAILEVRAEALPQLTLTSTYDHQAPELIEFGGGGGGGAGALPGAPAPAGMSSVNRSWRVALEVRQLIYDGGRVASALEIAKFTEDISLFQLRDTVDKVIARVRTQFTQVLIRRGLIQVQEESVKLQQDLLSDQKNRFEAGTVPRFNVLRAEVELANVQPSLIRARNAYLVGQLELARSLGLEPDAAGKPTFNAVGNLGMEPRTIALAQFLDIARGRRPFLKAQRMQILSDKEQIKIALAGYKPRVEFRGGGEMRNTRLRDDLDDYINGWFFGVSGSWNIFDGFATAGRVDQARARLESSKISYDDAVRQVELEVQQAYSNLLTARETVRSLGKNVEQALEALRLANERFSAGAGTQLDVLDARVALTRARITELEARGEYNIALAELDRATATDTVYDDPFDDPLAAREKAALGLKPNKKSGAGKNVKP